MTDKPIWELTDAELEAFYATASLPELRNKTIEAETLAHRLYGRIVEKLGLDPKLLDGDLGDIEAHVRRELNRRRS